VKWPVTPCGPLLTLAVATAPSALAEVVIEDQSRRLDVSVEVWTHDNQIDEDVPVYQESGTASYFRAGPFSRSLDARDSFRSHGTASQESNITPSAFSAQGRVSVYSSSDVADSAGMGSSSLNVTFRADAPQQYLLRYDEAEAGNAVGEGMRWDLLLLRLNEGADSSIIFQTANPFHGGSSTETPDPLSGVILPGRYQFVFDTSQETDVGSTWVYSFDFGLAAVPEPRMTGVALVGPGIMLRRRRHRVCSNA
jgi:hypothetical protein